MSLFLPDTCVVIIVYPWSLWSLCAGLMTVTFVRFLNFHPEYLCEFLTSQCQLRFCERIYKICGYWSWPSVLTSRWCEIHRMQYNRCWCSWVIHFLHSRLLHSLPRVSFSRCQILYVHVTPGVEIGKQTDCLLAMTAKPVWRTSLLKSDLEAK